MNQNTQNKAAPERCANTAPKPEHQAAEPSTGATTVPAPNNTDAPKGKKQRRAETPPPRVPAVARWALRIGGGLALLCGALLSFFALFGLAVLNGWPRVIAWALPGCIDVLTATAAVVAMSVPRTHRGARIAHWCAGVSLAITVGCNVEYHALLPAHWTTGHIFLVATGAVPAVVVELIIVMQMYLGDGAALATADQEATAHTSPVKRQTAQKNTAERSDTPPVPAVAADRPPVGSDATRTPAPTVRTDNDSERANSAANGRPSMDRWVEVGRPVYERLARELGKRPPENPYCEALAAHAARLIAAGELPEFYADPSVPAAKRVRAAVEERFPALAPLRPVPDDEERAAS